MSQCVPSWDLDDNPSPPPPWFTLQPQSNSNFVAPDDPRLDYEVAELTWQNGQLAMHGLGPPRVPNKTAAPSSHARFSWDKLPAGGTLESIVDQASSLPHLKQATVGGGDCGDELAPWFDDHRRRAVSNAPAAFMTMDALVPCSNGRKNQEPLTQALDSVPGIGTCVVDCSTRVGSCSGTPTHEDPRDARLARIAYDWSSRADQSVSGSATYGCGRHNSQVTLDTCEREFGAAGFTSTSLGSPENTSFTKQCTNTTDDHDSVCYSRNQEDKRRRTGKMLTSAKRSRAAAIHNQSERKRRDKINQRMKTLQKLVPNSSKSDKASMLDEVIEYLKQLQAQVQMMRINMSQPMMPLAMQQQLQMSMMASMGMGMGMNMGMGLGVMDLNTMGRSNITGMPPVLHPSAFMPVASWDSPGDRLAPATSAMPDPLTAFLACQSQPMTMDAYSRMATLYHQQFQQPPGPASRKTKSYDSAQFIF